MKFGELAKYLERLEKTRGRIAMTKILAQMFKQAAPQEARLIAYLSQGRLGPAYNNPDFGVADKMMVRALGEGAEKLFKQKGDLGLVAQELSRGRGDLSVEEVHQRLMDIAGASGQGSQERKQKMIGELLGNLGALSARYAVRIILGKLRTGFSDMTVLDSLSWMLVGDKSKRAQIESLYNVRANLGEVAERVKRDKGVKGKMSPKMGTPVLMARAERAASPAEIWQRTRECAVEYKLDGLRIQAHVFKSQIPKAVRLFSRGLEDVTVTYPDIVSGLQRQVRGEGIVEGEMIAVDKQGRFLPFQETVQRKRKYDIEKKARQIPLQIFLFDVLAVGGRSLLNQPNSGRWQVLAGLVGGGERVKLMPRQVAKSAADIARFFDRAVGDGTEGIIAKKLDSVYQAGSRNFNWIKYKKSYSRSALADTVDAVVMGYDAGQGKRAGFGIGDFLIGVYDADADQYLTLAKIGTGLTDEEWRQLKFKIQNSKFKTKPGNYKVTKQMECDQWVKPELVVEILADEITKSPMHTTGYALRFPRLVGWREKSPQDTTTLAEIKGLFKLQKIKS